MVLAAPARPARRSIPSATRPRVGFPARRSAVKNLITGFFLLLDKPFKINDWIEVDGVSGGVIDIGLRSTKTDAESLSVPLVTFGESSLDLEVVYGRTDPDEWRTTIHDVNMGIKGRLDRIRVDFAVPVERGFPGDAA